MKERLVTFLKFACFVYLVFIIPKAISMWGNQDGDKRPHFMLGIENLASTTSGYKNLKKLKFGLICDNKSFDQSGQRTIDVLLSKGFDVKKIFVSENRKDSLTRKVFTAKRGRDIETDVPLYFVRGNPVKFIERNVDGLDAFFVDLHDEGVKSDKSITFLQDLFGFASEREKRIVVLDKPNFFGGVIEGPGEIPWRHGLTIGELAVYINRHVIKSPANLTIVPLKRWRRGSSLANLCCADDGISKLLDPLYSVSVPTEKLSRWETSYFKRLCWNMGLSCADGGPLHGLDLSLKKNISDFSIFNSFLTIGRFLSNRKQIELSFKDGFDGEFGFCDAREFLQGHCNFDTLKSKVERSLEEFYDKSKYCCLYKPLPRVVKPEIVKG